MQIASEPPQSFFAGFTLSGSAEAGELTLTSPLGNQLAVMKWKPGQAVLQQAGEQRHYDSLDDLARQVTGTAIPVRALFSWLRGQPEAAEGWLADLSGLDAQRLVARRAQPLPAAELRLVLDSSGL